MTQSNSVPSPPKRERYAASNTHRHHTLLNMTQKTSSELFKEILSPEILLERLPNVVENAPEPNCPYKPTCSIREEYGRPIYGVAFNSVNRSQPSDPLYFATVSGHYVTVYQCHLKDDVADASSEDSSRLEPVSTLLTFADPAGDEEEFYCCAWSHDASERSVFNSWGGCSESRRPRPTPHPHQGLNDFYSGSVIPPHQQIVAVAGKRGVIRILCPSMLSCLGSLVGHGGSINELKFHPKDLSLLFSFSKDYTIRLWNVATNVLICVFGGSEGHRAEVLHGDVSLSGNLLLSAGMDHYIKIWRLNTPELANSISESFDYRLHTNTSLIAEKLAALHCLPIDEFRSPNELCGEDGDPRIFSRIIQWINRLQDDFINSSRKSQNYESIFPSKAYALNEMYKIKQQYIPNPISKIVLCHNDLNAANIILAPDENSIHLIDMEYCDLNYAAFDIGNHFCEFTGPYALEFDKYPSLEFQKRWMKVYLSAYREYFRSNSNLKHNDNDDELSVYTEDCLEIWLKEVNCFALLSNLLWAIWAVICAAENLTSMDYLAYAAARMKQYHHMKKWLETTFQLPIDNT